MGAGQSTEPPPVDLLPPRFERKSTPHERIAVSPLESLFGAEKRDTLFTSYVAQPGTVAVRLAMAPDYDQRAHVGVSTVFAADAVASSQPSASLAPSSFPTTVALSYAAGGATAATAPVHVQARMGLDGSARAVVTAALPDPRWGVYGLLPLDALGGFSLPPPGSAVAPHPARRADVGFGIGGPPVRLTHLRSSTAGPSGGGGAAVPSVFSDAHSVVSPTAITGSVAGSGTGAAGTAGPHPSSATAAASAGATLPEVGVRFLSSTQTWMTGVHASPFPPYPTKAWAVGVVGGNVTAGVQVGTTGHRLAAARAGQVAGGVAAGMDPQDTSTASAGAGTPSPFAAALPFDVDAAVSVSQQPLFELSLALDGARKEVVAGYVHNMTLRRKVYNVLEDAHVKGIYNYLDLGVEMRRSLGPGPPNAALAVGASWQLNKNLLVKGRVGTRDAAASVAFKSWTDPAVTLCGSYSVDRAHGRGGVGLYLSIERGGEAEFVKAVAGYQAVTPTRTLLAAEQLSMDRTPRERTDMQPLAPPPPRTGNVKLA